MVIFENIDIDIVIDKAILQNIDIDKISIQIWHIEQGYSSNNKNPILGMSERLNGVNWTRTPLARTSGPHMTNDMSLDSFVFISNSCIRMYARHHQLS